MLQSHASCTGSGGADGKTAPHRDVRPRPMEDRRVLQIRVWDGGPRRAPTRRIRTMKAPAVDYVRPRSLTEAIDQLARAAGEARVIAGGQSLVAMMNLRLAAPGMLI